MTRYLSALAVILMPIAANANGHDRPMDLDVACNKNGAAVTVQSGLLKGEVFYLGKSCDASQKDGASGTWGWSANAPVITFSDGTFLRLIGSVSCPSLPRCIPE